MTDEYITAEEHLPEDPDGETTLQVTDRETKEIFVTRARVARDRAALSDPDPLTVVRGPHENIEEQWYIEIIETAGVDRDRLRQAIRESRGQSNVVNARSADLRAMLSYLVATGEYESVSEAVRSLLTEHLTERYPELVDAYVEVHTELERDRLIETLGSDR